MKIITPLIVIVIISTMTTLISTSLLLDKMDELNKTNEELLKYKTDSDFIQGGDISKSLDSLTNEVFIREVEMGRHEVTREEILSKYPKVKEEYNLFYKHQTE
jgi:hypothetical protein